MSDTKGRHNPWEIIANNKRLRLLSLNIYLMKLHETHLTIAHPIRLVTIWFKPFSLVAVTWPTNTVTPPGCRTCERCHVLTITTTLPTPTCASVCGCSWQGLLALCPVFTWIVLPADIFTSWTNGSCKVLGQASSKHNKIYV